MANPIASLGMGGSSGLNSNTIKNLRDADEAMIIKPIDKKIDDYKQKIDSVSTFTKLLSKTKESASELKDDYLYLQRKASIIGEGVTAIAEDGVEPQNINIKVEQLATKHVIQSDALKSKESSVAADDSHFTINVGKKSYDFDVKAGMTLRDLVGEINQRASADVEATILKTGQEEFRLVLSTAKEGSDNLISIEQGTMEGTKEVKSTQRIPNPVEYDAETGFELPRTYEDIEVVEIQKVPPTDLSIKLFNEIQKPQDALFTYNGTEIIRHENRIDDLVVGLTIVLEEVTPENKRVNIAIEQDTEQVLIAMQGFVESYNALMGEIDVLTKFDPEKEEQGLFLGENSINSVRSSLSSILTSVDVNGKALAHYGFTMTREGKLEFSPFEFERAFKRDPKAMQAYFQGSSEAIRGRNVETEGIFYKINNTLDDLVNSADGAIVNFGKSLESQLKRTQDEKKRSMERLDSRYETMSNQFAAADSSINKMKKGFETVDMQIKQAQASR